MLADLALLGGLWALVALGERETRGRWVAFVACGVVAVWSEYASVITWAAIVLGGLWTGRPNRVRLMLLGGAATATLVAWLPEIVRGQDQVGITKLTPQTANPSLSAARNMVVTLAFGEHGGTSSGVLRWLAVLLAVGLAAAGGWCVRRRMGGLRGARAATHQAARRGAPPHPGRLRDRRAVRRRRVHAAVHHDPRPGGRGARRSGDRRPQPARRAGARRRTAPVRHRQLRQTPGGGVPARSDPRACRRARALTRARC